MARMLTPCLPVLLALLPFTGCSVSHFGMKAGSGCVDECGERASFSCGEPACSGISNNDSCGEGCSEYGNKESNRHSAFSNLDGGVEHGRRSLILDSAGWVVGIPSKILLWNTKVDSHSVSRETEAAVQRYLEENGLSDVKVRVNQYDPVGEWKRLIANDSIHAGWRYTFGTLAVAKYTVLPGRVVGSDEYNPFTRTIHLYSDRASLALREGVHARQATDAAFPGLYGAAMYLPGSPLWVDTPATREVVAWAQEIGDRRLQRESYLVLYPAYGARVGQSLTGFIDVGQNQAISGGFALVGHLVGRTMATTVSDTPVEVVKSAFGIVRRRYPQENVAEPLLFESAELQNALPPGSPLQVQWVPIEFQPEAAEKI